MATEMKKNSSNSVQISSGPPAVYKLKPQKKNFGRFTRVTVGEKNPDKINKTILLVGETGAGKSALINALVNYTMGVKWEEKVWFQIVEKSSQTESQTSDVIVYEIFGFEDKTLPYSLTIINTPGYGKKKGIKHDEIVRQKLLDLFRSEDGIHEVHAVGLVVKAGENRLTDRLTYIFNSVLSLFGKDVGRNIVVLITHSGIGTPTTTLKAFDDANIKCVRNKENVPVHFLFNNQQNILRKNENEFFLLHAWKVTNTEFRRLKEFLEKTSPQQLQTFMLNERIRLTACIQNLHERIELTELKQSEIQQFQQALMNKNQENKKFTVEIDEVYKEKRPINGGRRSFFYEGAVCCMVCEENCHFPGCTIASNPETCEVMEEGHCTSCTGRCPASNHVKDKWRYVASRKRVQGTKEEIKMKFKNKGKLLKRLNEVMKVLTREKSDYLDESYQLVVTLQRNVNSVSAYVHVDFLIEKMKERGDTEKVQKLEEMRSRVDERTRAALRISNRLSEDENVDLISSGFPAVYQLRPKKETFGTLTRMTVGEKNVKKTNKTILLVGESGTGKSTLINALVNYTIGVKWEDEVWFQILEDVNTSQAESQTSDVIVYEIFGFEDKTLPYSLTIIDTPGYGDTRGIGCDEIVIQRLFDLFRSDDGVREVHAVGLVMKASVNRLSNRLSYIFDSVMSLFGKDMEKSIVALITHSDGRRPKNAFQALEAAKINCAKNEKNQPVHFLFNSCQHEDRTEEEEYLKIAGQISEKGMRDFTDFLEKTSPQKLDKTVDVLNERIRLTACIQNLQDRIKLTELKQTEIRQIQEALKKHKEGMKKHQNFTVELDEVYKDKKHINGGMYFVFYRGAVCCTICEENCHYPGCTMAWYAKHCEVMKDGCCTVCTGKCLALDHVKENWIYVTKTRKIQRAIEDVKQKYEKHKAESQNTLSLLQNLEREMNQLTAEKSQLLDESYQHLVRLEQIALKADSASTILHLDFLIEKMEEEGNTEKVQKLEEMRSRVDEGTIDALQYTYSMVKKVPKTKIH
ncbi:uncharacterized protein LOC116321274 isoform X2 [Oreochromis aureus]|uniref:uncharacterized protein LOC116321274 isoform X2 n=1 Tax=Oreochromis aureus TaxID=47969 RepID=UPI0019537B93|nr:uncharacterized protein LOC116321274 isoform X2 [Oreochromis aureus]